jgi:hypothetical protein
VLVRCTACTSAHSGGRRVSTSRTTDLLGMLVAPIFRNVCSVLAGSGSDWNNTMVPRLGLIAQRVTGQWRVWLCPCGCFGMAREWHPGQRAMPAWESRPSRDRAKDPTREYAIPWNRVAAVDYARLHDTLENPRREVPTTPRETERPATGH